MDIEFNDGLEPPWYEEDPTNQSRVQLEEAISSVMEKVDDKESDEEKDLTGESLSRVLIDYWGVDLAKVIRSTTLSAATPFSSFKTIISKLLRGSDASEVALAYQISVAMAEPPTGISAALDTAKEYLEMIQTYIQKLESRDEEEKKNVGKAKKKAVEPKPFQVWVFDTCPKVPKGKGKSGNQGVPKAKDHPLDEADCKGSGGNSAFMGEYIKKFNERGNPYTVGKIPAELGITASATGTVQVQGRAEMSTGISGPMLTQDRLQIPSTSVQSSSRIASPQPILTPQSRSSSQYGSYGFPPVPSSAIKYPKLSEWLKSLDENPARAHDDQQFVAFLAAFKNYGWERLDDILDQSVNAQLLIEVVKAEFEDWQPLKPGSATALLRWAKEDAKAIVEGASFRLLGDFMTAPHWSR
ncbi:hypothetical protein FRB90_002679 [Tulasnella sp. 427]|nr:hypothetical protein FRB90_002679 [Tulasnella sp. 427]